MKTSSTFILLLFLTIGKLPAQEFQLTFAGTGASTTVDTVKVENLAQGITLTLSGSDVLHFSTTSTGISPAFDNMNNTLRIYPNPTYGSSTVEFAANVSGPTNFELFDLVGKRIGSSQQLLDPGKHSFEVSGLNSGVYIIRISSQDYAFSGKLVSNAIASSAFKIKYIGNSQNLKKSVILKNASTEKVITYNIGDRLKITGISGIYRTIITDIPTQSKTITFAFVACTDADGNNYPVVQIGNQIWMAENLKTTKYNDGSILSNITDNNIWNNLQSGAYCWYENNISLKDTYGALYNWNAISTKKLAPIGWHVPTDAEWTTLTNYLGGEANAGNKLKETGAKHWKSPIATNETGFTALPCGFRDYKGTFQNIGSFGYWWSSSPASTMSVWYRLMYNNNSNVGRYYSNKSSGYAVRCVKD
jgi:uncharacterized protein (TIGR02145 family)